MRRREARAFVVRSACVRRVFAQRVLRAAACASMIVRGGRAHRLSSGRGAGRFVAGAFAARQPRSPKRTI
ncbi:hypothetical protein AQ775_19120 [Burkholderia pseudomallei]|nr:hypothetical protein ACT79_04790 [Burkholderia pseudomallei]EDO89339.1 hypothetical protein BURPSPAST_AC0347 [Burkholderia pseudomallei Pasteur 52237]AYX39893.1 hypothetical protein EGY15_34820 [Burkholderia pseudomallei]OAB09801.1 hypothetical protein AQ846_27995 [Burkholderia pseudomallei]OMR42130.1 hypothetical protein AQ723_07665 [Burkholderia pseudomallei]